MDLCPAFQGLASSLVVYKRESTKDKQKDCEHQLDLVLTHSSNGRQLSGNSKNRIMTDDVIVCGLTSLIEKRSQPCHLVHKALMVLTYLTLDSDILQYICTHSPLMTKLARFLEYSTDPLYKSCLLQALKLLQQITYMLTVACPNGSIEDILDYSVQTIVSENSAEYKIASLEIISNLSYTNISVQAYLKCLSNANALNRVLISNMKDESLAVIILSLSILSSLWLDEDLGMRIFNGSNIEQTFQLIFKLVCQSPDKTEDSHLVIKSCVDLFCNITQALRIQTALEEYQLLPKHLRNVCKLFSIADSYRASLLLKLLLSVCRIDRPIQLLVKIVLYEGEHSHNIFMDILGWIGQPLQTNQNTTFLSIDLLTELFKVDPGPSGIISRLAPALNKQLTIGVNCLRTEHNHHSHGNLYLTKLTKLLHLASTICKHASLLRSISDTMSDQLLFELYTFMLSCTQSLFDTQNDRDVSDKKLHSIQLLLAVVNILAALKDSKHSFQETHNTILEDPRLLPYLCYALTHSDRRETILSIELLRDALQRPNFHISNFGNLLATTSLNQRELMKEIASPLKDTTQPARQHHTALKLDPNSVEDSIERMRSGMRISEMRNTDIIDIYEYKLSTLETKVSQIEALQEAKSLSLQQSERLVAQLRCKLADSESECQKLSNSLTQFQSKLLQEEGRVKCFTEREKELIFENDSLKRDIIALKELEVKCLQLAGEVVGKSKLCEKLESDLQRETALSLNMHRDNEVLEVNINTLRSQQERLLVQLKDTEIEKQKYKQRLIEKDKSLKELEVTVAQHNTKFSQIERQLAEVTAESGTLTQQVLLAQKNRETLQERMNELQSDKIKLNNELQVEREGQKLTKARLDKMQQLAEMIHNLSGTSVNPDSPNFLRKPAPNV